MNNNEEFDFLAFLEDYINDAKDGFQKTNTALLILENDPGQLKQVDEVFRAVHTLKSSSKMLEMNEIADLAEILESFLDRMRKNLVPIDPQIIDLVFLAVDTLEEMVKTIEKNKGKKEQLNDFKEKVGVLKKRTTQFTSGKQTEKRPAQKGIDVKTTIEPPEKTKTMRVKKEILDSLFNLAGELIITKNRLETITSSLENKQLKPAVSELSRLVGELQDTVSAARLVPAFEIFQKFPRLVRDLCKDANKRAELDIIGGEVEFDKDILEIVNEPIIHLLRNAVDHGIEASDIRKKKKKPEIGNIQLAAKRIADRILISIEDDGNGIDPDYIKKVALDKGVITPEEASNAGNKKIIDLLYEPSFSTKKEVTGVSGRGVGLDVVNNSVKKLGGSIELTTEKDKGSRFEMSLPLTTTIMQTLLVSCIDGIFAIPSTSVFKTVDIISSDIKEVYNEKYLLLDNQIIPFYELSNLLGSNSNNKKSSFGVTISYGNKIICLGVDDVIGQIESIVKPFDPVARKVKGFSGGIILGDGQVILLLDITGLI